MIEIDVRRTIPAPADAVWSELRSFEGIENWLAMIAHSEVRGDGAGATRVCTTVDGGRLVERLEEVDDGERRLVYTIQEAPMPLQDYRSTMRVLPDGQDASTVVWSATFDAPDDAAEQLESTMRGVYESGLDGLRASFGGA
ncbi:MAG: SRPBCC family protein [Trueperaceae bacterium]|nr:SRPBCC family protein [Trueperaceae bacterium]